MNVGNSAKLTQMLKDLVQKRFGLMNATFRHGLRPQGIRHEKGRGVAAPAFSWSSVERLD